MGLVSFLSSLYLIFTVILMFKKNSIGNIYIPYGVMAFIFVMSYIGISTGSGINPVAMQIGIFIIFSLMILLFGITCGTFMTILNKSNKISIIVSILSSIVLIIVLFNIKGYLTYMYIPVILYKLQDYINEKIYMYKTSKI